MSKESGKSDLPTGSQPSSRPPRMKSIPNRLHHGVDRFIRGIRQDIPEAPSPNPKKRGVTIKEPSSSPAKKKKTVEQSKAQGKKPAVPKGVRSKRAQTSVSISSGSSESSTDKSEAGPEESSPFVANAIEEIKLHKSAPKGFAIAPVPLNPGLNVKFKDQYSTRGFCAVVSVDLPTIYRECNIDLSPWFGAYQSFISIEAAYYPELVKMFYFNMVADHLMDSDGGLVEERLTTTVKGVKFTLSASILNQILKVSNPPPAITPTYSNEEVYSTLCPGKEIPDSQRHHLSFKPSEMSPTNRVIWYVWSRNFVQKGGSFTHMTAKDYRFFTAFVKKHPLNIGQWIFKEMNYFKFVSRKSAYIPFPQLVSLILFYHRIWYVGPPAEMKYIPVFGKAQFNFMKISFEPEGSGQSRAPQRSHTQASRSVAHEAQSAPPPPPSDFESKVKEIVDAAVTSLFLRMQFEFGKLTADLKIGLNEIMTGQEEMQAQLANIKNEAEKKQEELSDQLTDLDARLSVQMTTTFEARDKIDKIIDHFSIGASSSTFGFTTAPTSSTSVPPVQPSSPSFAFQSPLHHPSPSSTSTPATIILPSPTSPSTEILPSPTSPSTEIFQPSSSQVPPQFDDAKGGEQ